MGVVYRPRRSPFYVAKTLMGGIPDCNRRTIYAQDIEHPVKVFNADMKPWTPEMEVELRRELQSLNDLIRDISATRH